MAQRTAELRADPQGCHETRLAHLRRLRGFTQRSLMEATGIHKTRLSRLEQGVIKRIRWGTAGKLARALAGESATVEDVDRVVADIAVISVEEDHVDATT